MDKGPPLAKRLREARIKSGLSQRQLGIAAGMDPFVASARINQYERGKHLPDYRTVERLGAVLNTPVPVFYTSDNELAELISNFAHLAKRDQREMAIEIRRRSKKVER